MTHAACSEGEFISLLETIGPARVAERLGIDIRNIYARRERLERKYNRPILVPDGQPRIDSSDHPARLKAKIYNGVVLIGSDAHYWPGIVSTAHRAFIRFCEREKPAIVIKNGDEFATISRFPPMNWEKRPTVSEEIGAVKDRLGEITVAAGKARRLWPLGNHDQRFEAKLAQIGPEYANVKGMHLRDHLPDWEPCWEVLINDDVIVRHRWKSGIHAPHNNTVQSGVTMITGHLHSQKVTPWSDYNGTRWGVDAGCIADPYSPQFEYLEGGPRNWRSGFVVLKFVNGQLLQPQPVRVMREGAVDYCNEVIHV